MKKFRTIPLIQAVYYTITAVWPLLHIRSFMEITGWKTDIWLVKTFSTVLVPYCFMLLYLTVSHKRNFIIVISIIMCCLGLAAVETYYYFIQRIRWVYQVDALIQLGFLGYWMNYIMVSCKRK